jgi:hypothetical protein
MSSHFKKIDKTQPAIVAALRKAGASVQSIASIGKGTPDLLVGFRRQNYLFEVKTGKGKLTDDELRWNARWAGECYIVNSPEGALKVIGAMEANPT